jgi:prefoldin subunit 5
VCARDLGEKIVFNLGQGNEMVSTTEEAIEVLWRLKERYSDRLYFNPAVAAMMAADQSGTDTAIREAVNDYKMFIYNTF